MSEDGTVVQDWVHGKGNSQAQLSNDNDQVNGRNWDLGLPSVMF